MASFTPDEKNIVLTRGFEPADGFVPLVPVESHEKMFDGFRFYEYSGPPQQIYEIGDIADWCNGNIHKSAIFWVSAVTAESEDYYNGSKKISVTIGDNGAGHGTIVVRYLDENDIPNASYYYGECRNITPDFIYSGTCYLCLAFWRGNLVFTYSYGLIMARNYTPMKLVSVNAFDVVNPSTWDDNQPFKYWYDGNDSGYYDMEEEVPALEPGGGGGGWYRPSDTIGFSGLPSLDVLAFNMVSMYKMTAAEMSALSTYLWSNDFITNIQKNWQDPFQNIINLAFVPLSSELTTSSAYVKIGNVTTTCSGARLTKSLYEKDFGSINMKELYKNFADYAPYTKLRIYLPGAGVRELNPDDYMDGSIHLKAYIDLFNGTCVYQLLSIRHGRQHIVDHYQANILTQIPVTGANFINAYASIINGAAQMASGVVSGNPAGVIGGATSIMTAKPTYEKSGSVTGSAMRLSVQSPYIFFDTPQLRQPTNFRQLNGYTSNIYARLGDCTDYVRVKYMDISGINAPDNIKQKILDSLYKGVHIH